MQNTARASLKPESNITNNVKHKVTNFRSYISSSNFTNPKHNQNTSLIETSNNSSISDYILQRNGYNISLVRSIKQQLKTNTFIKHMYSSRGYLTDSATASANNPNQITFIASIEETIVGTVTLGIDSNEGLLADELYRKEITSFRNRGKKVCELSKFALDPERSSKEIIASLFQAVYIYARNIYQATDYFCEVNPRHAAPQKRMFGFNQIGELRSCPRVNAPAVLLHLEINHITNQISHLANTQEQEQRSLYSYFLPQHIENRITNEIQNKLTGNKVSGENESAIPVALLQ